MHTLRLDAARRRRLLALLALIAFLGASCGGDDDDVVAGGGDESDEDSSDESTDESSDDDSSDDDSSDDDSSDDESSDDDSSDESTDESSDEGDGGSGDDEFCSVGEEIDASNAMLDETDDPEALEDGINDILDLLEDARDDAPDDIADDFNTIVDAYGEVNDVLEGAGYDFTAIEDEDDLAVFDEFADAVIPVEEWFAENCGIVLDDGGSNDDGSTDGGSAEGGLASVTSADIADLEPGLPAPGPDAEFDSLWEDCADGSLEACDDLYFATPVGSLYEAFGGTCGGTDLAADFGTCELSADGGSTDGGSAEGGLATATGDEDLDGDTPAPGPDSTLDALWEDCGDGDDSACDELWQGSPFDSVYELYATICGGREPDNASGNPCVN